MPAAYLSGAIVALLGLSLPGTHDGDGGAGDRDAGHRGDAGADLAPPRRHFTAAAVLPPSDALPMSLTLIVTGAGLAGTAAIWADKWLLWFGPDSAAALGHLRLNPINDLGSFLGLLTLVPGLTRC
ncbi:exopolysaccharide Pel transporter PelG [Sphingomonas sp. MMS24-JH45]